MTFKSLLFKSVLKTIAISGVGLTSLFSFSEGTKAENFNMVPCPASGTKTLSQLQALASEDGEFSCLHTPDQYKLTIYEMGLCEFDPMTTGAFVKANNNCVQTMLSVSGTEVDLAPGTASSKSAALPSSSVRPASGIYNYAYVLLSNAFKMKGSYELLDGTTYKSKELTDIWGKYGVADKSIDTAEEHIDLVDNMYFGDEENGWDGYMSPTAMPGGGNVSALLLKNCIGDTCTGNDALAESQGQVKRLLGVFETNSGSPVEITNSTNGLEVELVVKADPNDPSNSGGGYLLMGWDEGSGFDLREFGSAPFKPKFTTF